MTKVKSFTATEEQVAQWKEKYPTGVYRYEVEGKACYLRKPDRKTLSAASVLGKSDPLKYNEVILKNCWLDGDEEIKTDDGLFLGISGRLAELIEIKEGELKKL
jgi:hypothetical protein